MTPDLHLMLSQDKYESNQLISQQQQFIDEIMAKVLKRKKDNSPSRFKPKLPPRKELDPTLRRTAAFNKKLEQFDLTHKKSVDSYCSRLSQDKGSSGGEHSNTKLSTRGFSKKLKQNHGYLFEPGCNSNPNSAERAKALQLKVPKTHGQMCQQESFTSRVANMLNYEDINSQVASKETSRCGSVRPIRKRVESLPHITVLPPAQSHTNLIPKKQWLLKH